MKPDERDGGYLWDMRLFAREAHRIVSRVSFASVEGDTIRRLALERALELVGEAARRVSRRFQDAHPQIAWRDLIGQRNVIAHDYGKISHRRLYDTAREKIPGLVKALDAILDED